MQKPKSIKNKSNDSKNPIHERVYGPNECQRRVRQAYSHGRGHQLEVHQRAGRDRRAAYGDHRGHEAAQNLSGDVHGLAVHKRDEHDGHRVVDARAVHVQRRAQRQHEVRGVFVEVYFCRSSFFDFLWQISGFLMILELQMLAFNEQNLSN